VFSVCRVTQRRQTPRNAQKRSATQGFREAREKSQPALTDRNHDENLRQKILRKTTRRRKKSKNI
jgi:hypothetical protein